MSLEVLHQYEKSQICVLADQSLIRHPQWLAWEALHEQPVLWLEVNEQTKSLETVTQIWEPDLSDEEQAAFEAFAAACRDHSPVKLPEGGRP